MTQNYFTPIRLCLAVFVALEHIFYFRAGVADSPFEIGHTSLAYFAVNGFFIISGYLITTSAERSGSLYVFARARVLRIMPALLFVVLFLGLIVAPLITQHDLATYFGAAQTWLGILSLLTFIDPYPDWPGVVMANTPFGNDLTGPIWTLRYEVLAYIGTGALLAFGLHRNKPIILVSAVIVSALFALDLATGVLSASSSTLGNLVRFGSCYLYGVLACLYRGRYLVRARVFVPSLLLGLVLLAGLSPLGEIVVNLALTPTLLTVAYLPVKGPKWLTSPPDISYGLYIFHWPIYVLLTEYVIAPTASLHLFALGLPLAILAAILSWWLVEKPALRLKARSRHSTAL